MGKKNKIRYKAEVKDKKLLTLSGGIFLDNSDEFDAQERFAIGDIKFYARSTPPGQQVDYFTTGMSGYFKFDIWDGKQWCLVLLDDIFSKREHHFSKTECPIDTYELVAEIMKGWAGKQLERTYREHYQPAEDDTR